MSDDEGKPSETLSKMKHRHEMEIKKLEQANKKAITSAQKSGKAGKAAAQDAAAVAMTTLQAEHAKQLSAWHAANDTAAANDNNDNDDDDKKASVPVESNAARAPAGLSKAAKRRLAKEKAEEEHNARIAEAAANSVDLSKVETDQLTSQLAPLRLRIVDVAADGNCLYAALADQARVHSLPGAKADVASFRAIAADYMLAHADDFAPFLDMPDDCTDMHALLRQYADKVRSTAEWGGQLELRALAAALQCVIVVHSAAQAPLRMGDDVAGAPELHVSYHKRLLSLGEHYNSVRPIQ